MLHQSNPLDKTLVILKLLIYLPNIGSKLFFIRGTCALISQYAVVGTDSYFGAYCTSQRMLGSHQLQTLILHL